MKKTQLTTASVSLISSLLFFACSSENSDIIATPYSEETTSSSSLAYSSSATHATFEQPTSSSTDAISSENENLISSSSFENVSISSAEQPVSSSATGDSQLFSTYLAQFQSQGESITEFDNHVVAINVDAFSASCENAVVSYDENEMIIPFNAISLENIEKCFPQTASHLSNKFTDIENIEFYTAIVQLGASPQGVVLDKFTSDEISIKAISPGGEKCILDSWGPMVLFLIADTDNLVKEENIPIIRKTEKSNTWLCNEKGTPSSIKNGGEWFNDSLL